MNEKYKGKIFKTYKETIDEIKNVDMVRLFNAIYDYQKKKLLKQDSPVPSFEFKRVDQDGYKSAIEDV